MKKRLTVMVDESAIVATKKILQGSGMSISDFVNIALCGLRDGKHKSVSQMYQGMATELVRFVTSIKEKRA